MVWVTLGKVFFVSQLKEKYERLCSGKFLEVRVAIDFIVSQVTNFASQTRDRNADWEVDLGNGSRAGTKYV